MKTWQDQMTKDLQYWDLGILGFLTTKEVECLDKQGRRQTKFEQYFAIRGIYSGESAEDGKKALAPLIEATDSAVYPNGDLWETQYPYAYMNEHLLENVEGVIPDTIKETKRCALIE
eukprot:scaffold36976_cov59-Attheya_sp.AAC.1